MRPVEIEAWVLSVVDQVKRGQPNEDSRVELKAEWIAPEKAARQIAGHANASRGANILWIIGLDEKTGIVGADHNNLANWYPVVKRCFSELVPDFIELNVPVEGKTLVALLFETDRAPFLVKNNNPECGQIEVEMPWREGTKTRSARRSDLIRLLEPLTHLPALEILTAECTIYEVTTNGRDLSCQCHVRINAYITPKGTDRIFIPCHHCNLSLSIGGVTIAEWQTVRLSPPLGALGMTDSHTISASSSEASVKGPGKLQIEFFAIQPRHFFDKLFESANFDKLYENASVVLKILPTGAQTPLTISKSLESTLKYGDGGEGGILGHWNLRS